MKIRYLFLVFVFLAAGTTALAQRRTVTNADLERFRQERVQGENDLRENYALLGFPAPEVIDQQNQRSRKEMLELSARLRSERLAQEWLEAQVRQAMWMADAARRLSAGSGDQIEYYDGGFLSGYYVAGGRRSRRFGARPGYTQPGYFAGGQFWPTGPSTPPQPAFNVRRR